MLGWMAQTQDETLGIQKRKWVFLGDRSHLHLSGINPEHLQPEMHRPWGLTWTVGEER